MSKRYKLKSGLLKMKGVEDMSTATICNNNNLCVKFIKSNENMPLKLQSSTNKYLDAFKSLSSEEVEFLNDMVEDND